MTGQPMAGRFPTKTRAGWEQAWPSLRGRSVEWRCRASGIQNVRACTTRALGLSRRVGVHWGATSGLTVLSFASDCCCYPLRRLALLWDSCRPRLRTPSNPTRQPIYAPAFRWLLLFLFLHLFPCTCLSALIPSHLHWKGRKHFEERPLLRFLSLSQRVRHGVPTATDRGAAGCSGHY